MSAVAPLGQVIDWKHPDFRPTYAWRAGWLQHVRKEGLWPQVFRHLQDRPADFADLFAMTFDPRAVERGLPAIMPMVLWPKQRAALEWMRDRWRAQEPGIIEKSRDCGMSWLAAIFAVWLCLFHRGVTVLLCSRKEMLVDNASDPNSLFAKVRFVLRHLPQELLGTFDLSRHSAHMRITLPDTNSAIVGEAGDQIGRGGRASVVLCDESAYFDRAEMIDGTLSAVTNCRLDISTPRGRGNSFANRRFSGKIPVLTMSWRDDPRKDEAWYAKQCETLDPVTVAAEIDLDYSGSVEGILIPSAWVQAAINAHVKLGIDVTGWRYAALDVADEGIDRNAFAARRGILLHHASSWSGKGSDIYRSVIRACALCDEINYPGFIYDADGLGAGVRGDMARINEDRRATGQRQLTHDPFRGSGGVYNPEHQVVPNRKNKDFFSNAKAQAWWHLRARFQETHRAVVDGLPIKDRDMLISIDPSIPELSALTMELSQPTYSINSVGKICIDKKPDGARSPNLGDAVMMAFSPAHRTIEIWLRCGGATDDTR